MKNQIPSPGVFAKVASKVMLPFMYLVSGTFRESPQQTLPWNNLKLKKEDAQSLSLEGIISYKGLQEELPRFKFMMPIFHLPIFGGWKNYVVLEPTESKDDWYIGWMTDDISGVSIIKTEGSLRVLLGNTDVKFFGLDKNNNQVKIKEIGSGVIGDGGKYCKLPLF